MNRSGLLFLLALVIPSVDVFAQDILWKKTGEKLEVIIQEVGGDYLKYKKFSNQEGPTYNIGTYDVLQVNFENGEVEKFSVKKPVSVVQFDLSKGNYILDEGRWLYSNNKKIGRRTLERWLMLLNDPASSNLYEKSRATSQFAYIAGFGAGGVGIVAFIAESTFLTGGFFLTGGVVLAVPLLVINNRLLKKYKREQTEAIALYNEAFKLKNDYDD
jgi:hypothetical protein